MRRLRTIGVVILVGVTAAGISNAAPAKMHGQTKSSVWFKTGHGSASRVFYMRQPRGIVRLTRLTTAYGIRASIAAMTVPGLAGVRVVNFGVPGNPSPCRRRRSFLVCTQSQEGCPMPRAVWRIHVLKISGPPGLVRFDFVVG